MFDCRSIICCLMFNDSDVNHSISACSVDWRSKLQAGSLHSRLFTKIVHTFGVFLRLMVESYLHYDYPPVIKHGNGESTIYGWFCHWNLIYRWFFALVKPSFLDDVPIFFVHSIFSNLEIFQVVTSTPLRSKWPRAKAGKPYSTSKWQGLQENKSISMAISISIAIWVWVNTYRYHF